MSRGKELARNTAILLMGKLFTQFLSFFMLPLYTNLIPREGYGFVDLLSTYIGIAIPVTTLQLEMAAFRYLIDARNDRNRQSEILKTTFRDLFLRIILFSIPYLIIIQFFDFEYKYLTLVCGISVAFSNTLLQISRGLGKNTAYAVGSILAGITTILSNLFLICVMKLGAESILISMTLANVVCSVFLLYHLKINRCINRAKSSKALSKAMIKYSWPLVPNGISWWLIDSSDRTIVSLVLGVAANGTYAIACKFPTIVSGFIGVFSYSWTESASLHINDKDKDLYFSSVANNALKVFSSIGICVIAFLPLIFDVIIGVDYRDAYNYIPIAVAAVVLNSLVLIYSAVYVAKKLTKKVAMTSAISALINIIIDIALVYFIGLYSAVLSTAIAFLIMAVYRHFDVKKYVNIRYDKACMFFVLLSFFVVFLTYYSGNYVIYIAGAVFAAVYSFIMNWGLIKTLKKSSLRFFVNKTK